ncbi:MAG: Nif11-like leader peptide family natural product precursor [Ignavibacteriales bacterium]
MSDAMKKLIEKVGNDRALQEKFNACKSIDEQVRLANELGFAVNNEDFARFNQDLTDDDLDKVAGGHCKWYITKCTLDLTDPNRY